MKSSRLTALFMFATLMAVTALAQGLTFNSQFYGPGYYRVISANGRAMNVIANTQNGITDMSAVQLLSLNPAQTTEADLHPLRSAAGSVLEAQLLQLPDDQMVGRSLNSPQLDLATQGSSTGEITSSGQIGRLAQSFLKIDRVPVSISDIDPETGNKWGAHPFFSGAEQYRAYFSIFGEYIYFK
ncbi:MAG: hypothetical protein IJ808_09705, partial [Muribaculaceae bacterium]|nr:hypothetical protein [Muribaculaceae bacterium]